MSVDVVADIRAMEVVSHRSGPDSEETMEDWRWVKHKKGVSKWDLDGTV
jgi:hypothetical protein